MQTDNLGWPSRKTRHHIYGRSENDFECRAPLRTGASANFNHAFSTPSFGVTSGTGSSGATAEHGFRAGWSCDHPVSVYGFRTPVQVSLLQSSPGEGDDEEVYCIILQRNTRYADLQGMGRLKMVS